MCVFISKIRLIGSGTDTLSQVFDTYEPLSSREVSFFGSSFCWHSFQISIFKLLDGVGSHFLAFCLTTRSSLAIGLDSKFSIARLANSSVLGPFIRLWVSIHTYVLVHQSSLRFSYLSVKATSSRSLLMFSFMKFGSDTTCRAPNFGHLARKVFNKIERNSLI